MAKKSHSKNEPLAHLSKTHDELMSGSFWAFPEKINDDFYDPLNL